MTSPDLESILTDRAAHPIQQSVTFSYKHTALDPSQFTFLHVRHCSLMSLLGSARRSIILVNRAPHCLGNLCNDVIFLNVVLY